MIKKWTPMLLVLLLTSLACSLTPAPTPNSQPSATSSGLGGTPGKVLYHDAFTNASSGWYVNSDTYGVIGYQNGGYEIHVQKANSAIWGTPSQSFPENVRIEVDAIKQGGVDDNAFGVICRYQDNKNFYKLLITSDGYAGISKSLAGETTVISASDGDLQAVNGISPGSVTNHIHADCIGSALTLYVNGALVASAVDNSFTSGGVGLVARTYNTPGTDIRFTNFTVYQP